MIGRRNPSLEIILAPCRVQGEGAGAEISAAIRLLNQFHLSQKAGGAAGTQRRLDLILVTRGGGSLEDLWAFNEEIVARAIYNSKIPVVSAVGHEIDFTISDFVADLRAPTPSAAAELVVRDSVTLLDIVRGKCYTLNDYMVDILRDRKEGIFHLLKSYSFNKPVDQLRQFSQRIDELERSMSGNVRHVLSMVHANTRSLHHRIQSLDPHLILKRGYTMVRKNGKIVDSKKMLGSNDVVEINFHDGVVSSTIS